LVYKLSLPDTYPMNPEWEVEDIVGWRRNRARNNKLEFLIRWKGYGPTEDSWASEFDLRNAQEL
ncbi:hypothetical protein DAEQUDRAFT_653373, partial [Daedalea quercina L-15889]